MEILLGKNINELQEVALSVGLPRFAGKQLAEWLYQKRVTTFDEMTNISKKGREALAEHYTIGRHAALNVEATPRGEYEAAIYRRIAYQWYLQCDEHCGDIIPGRITISLRLLRNGSIANMDLIHRRGASVSQQSFTFTAIRCASLPPMPAAVQKSFPGDKLELIFDFNFD